MSERTISLSLRVLSLCFFALGTASLSVVGALQSISSALGLSQSQIAMLVPAFAVTFALGAPAIQLFAGHLKRRSQLLMGLGLMAAGAVGCAVAPSYALLIAARVLTGLGAAVVSPTISALGTSLVPVERQGHALAVVFMGMTMASVLGVPLSSWCAAMLGWRAMFGAIAVLAIVAARLAAMLIRDQSRAQPIRIHDIGAVLGNARTLGVLLITVLAMAALFTTYTMITPILRDEFGAGSQAITWALLIYGVAGVAGNQLARYVSLRWPAEQAVGAALLLLIIGFAVIRFAPPWFAMAILGLIPWAVAVDVLLPSQQRRIVELMPHLRGLVLALNSSALFVGMAVGGTMASHVTALWGLKALPGVSIGLAAFAWVALQATKGGLGQDIAQRRVFS